MIIDALLRAKDAQAEQWRFKFEFAETEIANLRAESKQLRARNAELVEVLQGLLQFNEELCADIGVSKHYPSAERARAAIAQAEGTK